MKKRRIRTWLLQRFMPKAQEEPLPPPTRKSNPTGAGRTAAEAERYSLFRLGWRGGYDEGYQAGRNSVLVSAIHTQHSLPSVPAVRAPLRDAPLHEMLAGIAPLAPPTLTTPKQFQTRVLAPLPPLEEEDGRIEFWEDRFLLDMTATTEKREAV
jgi:hypothetical protein